MKMKASFVNCVKKIDKKTCYNARHCKMWAHELYAGIDRSTFEYVCDDCSNSIWKYELG